MSCAHGIWREEDCDQCSSEATITNLRAQLAVAQARERMAKEAKQMKVDESRQLAARITSLEIENAEARELLALAEKAIDAADEDTVVPQLKYGYEYTLRNIRKFLAKGTTP